MIKIAVMNATKVSIEPIEQAVKMFPDVQIFHFMDEGMSYLGKTEGCISGKNLARMVNLIHSAQELGVDGILLSCTIFSPYVDILRQCTDLPLVAADIGVFEKAAREFTHVGAVVSFRPTIDSVTEVVKSCKERINPNYDVEIKLADGAFEAMAAGDEETHNRMLYETAVSMMEGKDAIILSQMSHTRAVPLFKDFPIPVLTSPPVSIQLLCDMIRERQK